MNCCLCYAEEKSFNFRTHRKEAVKPAADVKRIICGNCVQILLRATQEQRRRAYETAKAEGYIDKAESLKLFFQEVENDGKWETGELITDIFGKESLRLAGPAD